MPSRFNSTVKLYKVDEIQKGRFPAFSSKANQTSFFNSRLQLTVNNCKIVRNSSTIRLNVPANKIYGFNYLSYINPDYGNKTIYCMVQGFDYINDQCTVVSIVEDPIQTWMFDVTMSIADTYIAREMLSQDKADLAEVNPYDPDLWEFDTPEQLPVSHELEIREYAIASYSNSEDKDTISGTQAAKMFKTNGQTTMMTILYVSNVNLDNMDYMWEHLEDNTGVTKPSIEWQTLLDAAAVITDGFVLYPNGDLDYDQMINDFKMTNQYPTACYIICSNTQATLDIIEFLTRWDAVSTIVNCIKVPKNLVSYCVMPSESSDPAKHINIDIPELDGIHNKKLYRFPFSYLRLMSPAGDIKELQYEWFESVRDGDGEFSIGIYADVINGFTLAAAPYDYKYELGGYASGSVPDGTEVLKFTQFPTAPLVIDAYLAQMSATAAQFVQQHTISNSRDYYSQLQEYKNKNSFAYKTTEAVGVITSAAAQGVSAAYGMTETVKDTGRIANPAGYAGAASSATSAFQSIADASLSQAKRGYDEASLAHQIDVVNRASGWLLGNNNGVFAEEYANTRGAYAADKYIAPMGPGFEHYAAFGWLNLAFVKVKLRDEILERYDKYFSSYGFTSGRVGRPYIMYFIAGNSSTNSLPEWINGETYCQTHECHVTAPYQYVSAFWEAAFNTGIHWLNGDEMINV